MASFKLSLSLSSLQKHHSRISPTRQFRSESPFSKTRFVTISSSTHHYSNQQHKRKSNTGSFSTRYRFSGSEDGDNDDEENIPSFDEAVELFNRREYYMCHDFLEAIWYGAEEPSRTLVHGILQCAVGFHHLFNHNHKGAMMELGEGLCKLRKMGFSSGPFHRFEQEISQVLEFVYQTQIELAACGDDLCVAMDRSERSYQLLGSYAAGQHVYELQSESDDETAMYIQFRPQASYDTTDRPRVKLPTLEASSSELLKAF